MLHFVLQKSRRISHTGFLHVPRSWLEDTNPPLVGIAGSVLANYRAYRCFVSAWTAKQKRRPGLARRLGHPISELAARERARESREEKRGAGSRSEM